MSSKVKLRNMALIDENKKLRLERQRSVRALIALIYQNGGPLKLEYKYAAMVQLDDQLNIQMDRKTGTFVISIVPRNDDGEPRELGRASTGVGLQIGEGDVGEPLQDGVAHTDSSEVQPGDQHDKSEV